MSSSNNGRGQKRRSPAAPDALVFIPAPVPASVPYPPPQPAAADSQDLVLPLTKVVIRFDTLPSLLNASVVPDVGRIAPAQFSDIGKFAVAPSKVAITVLPWIKELVQRTSSMEPVGEWGVQGVRNCWVPVYCLDDPVIDPSVQFETAHVVRAVLYMCAWRLDEVQCDLSGHAAPASAAHPGHPDYVSFKKLMAAQCVTMYSRRALRNGDKDAISYFTSVFYTGQDRRATFYENGPLPLAYVNNLVDTILLGVSPATIAQCDLLFSRFGSLFWRMFVQQGSPLGSLMWRRVEAVMSVPNLSKRAFVNYSALVMQKNKYDVVYRPAPPHAWAPPILRKKARVHGPEKGPAAQQTDPAPEDWVDSVFASPLQCSKTKH